MMARTYNSIHKTPTAWSLKEGVTAMSDCINIMNYSL